jgi:hypothetical protein
MLAGILEKHGLKVRVSDHEAISAAHIVSLDAANAKLVCLSYLDLGGNTAHIRYLIRRLRRILPSGCILHVGYWAENGAATAIKALAATAGADAYAISLREAAEIALNTIHDPELEVTRHLHTDVKASAKSRR